MPDIDPLAVAIAAVAALAFSGSWYALVPADTPEEWEAARTPPAWLPAAELLRNVVVALVVAGLTVEIGIDDAAGGLLLGVSLFVGFPAVLFAGSILHEGYPGRMAAVHLGDWLLKLMLIGAIVAAFQ